jgi:hypothetical protein
VSDHLSDSPFQRALERGWDAHPERDRLVKLKRSGWRTVYGDDPDDSTWFAIWLRPDDPRDTRPWIRIVTLPKEWERQQLAYEQAIAEEHDEGA